MQFFIDADVIFDFMEIRRLDLLFSVFERLYVVFRIDEQVEFNRGLYEAQSGFVIANPEEEWERKLVEMKDEYGRGPGYADRSAAIATCYSHGKLLTRDEELKGDAIEFLKMSDEDFISTVEVFCMLVGISGVTKSEAINYCEEISLKRQVPPDWH